MKYIGKADLLGCLTSLEKLIKGSDNYTQTRIASLELLIEVVWGSGFCTDKEVCMDGEYNCYVLCVQLL